MTDFIQFLISNDRHTKISHIQFYIFIIKTLKEQNIGVLITDHNVRETVNITDRAYLLYEGEILKEGTAEELIADKDAKRLYLGNTFKEEKNNE